MFSKLFNTKIIFSLSLFSMLAITISSISIVSAFNSLESTDTTSQSVQSVTSDTDSNTVNLLSPNGGEKWRIGNSYKVKWELSSLDLPAYPDTSYFLTISVNEINAGLGSRAYQVDEVTPEEGQNTLDWNIPADIPIGEYTMSAYLYRQTQNSERSSSITLLSFDTTQRPFEIHPASYLEVVYPNGFPDYDEINEIYIGDKVTAIWRLDAFPSLGGRDLEARFFFKKENSDNSISIYSAGNTTSIASFNQSIISWDAGIKEGDTYYFEIQVRDLETNEIIAQDTSDYPLSLRLQPSTPTPAPPTPAPPTPAPPTPAPPTPAPPTPAPPTPAPPTPTPTPEPVMKNVEATVKTYTDIANQDGTDSLDIYSGKTPWDIKKERWIGTGSDTENSYLGLRFPELRIPENATITSAKLVINNNKKDQWISTAFTARGEKNSNPQQFTNEDLPSERTTTQSSTTYKANEKWQKGTDWEIEVTDIAQEVYEESGSIDTMALILHGEGSSYGRKFINITLNGEEVEAPVKLVVEYEVVE